MNSTFGHAPEGESMSGKGGPELKKFMDKKVMRECRSPRACRAPRAHAARPRIARPRSPLHVRDWRELRSAGRGYSSYGKWRGEGRWRYEGPGARLLLRDPRL